jgi:DNA-binding HxlR family transcriptional regulator
VQILALLSVPLNVTLLRTLQTGPRRQDELRHESGCPAKGVLRSCLETLERFGIVVRRGHYLFPGSREYELAEPGHELRFVMVSLERWLTGHRWERLELDSDAGAAAIKTVLDAWSSNIMRAIAARPCSLAELGELVAPLDHASLERHVEAMRLAGLLETVNPAGRATYYTRTAWLCRAMGPIVAASRWERGNLPEASPEIGRTDAETALLLTMPLLQLPPNVTGSCRLIVEVSDDGNATAATVTATAEGCRVTSYEAASGDAGASASGPPSAWFRAAIEADPDHLKVAGDHR